MNTGFVDGQRAMDVTLFVRLFEASADVASPDGLPRFCKRFSMWIPRRLSRRSMKWILTALLQCFYLHTKRSFN